MYFCIFVSSVIIAVVILKKRKNKNFFSLDMPGELEKHKKQIIYAGNETIKELKARGYLKPGTDAELNKRLIKNFKGINSDWTDEVLNEEGQDAPDGYDLHSIWDRHYKRFNNYMQLKTWKKDGVLTVQVEPQKGNRKTCSKAVKHSGLYKIEKAPILPCEDCDSENCLCWYTAVDWKE